MLNPNTLLQNRYLIIRLLAEGGMGAVYEAKDQRLGNTVALKETFFADDEMRRAFHREAALLATLRHPALPKVIDHFNEESGQFLVMEFIRGDDLSRVMKLAGGPVPQRDALAWADQLLGALEYLHAQRPPVIHRDIKPQNIKLNERGEVILLDFGLAKEASATGAINRSVRGYTLVYAPLEQIQGTGTDPRSDLYSVAATVYHLLTGLAPADAVARATAFIQELPDPLRPAHEVNPGISPAVSAVLAEALSQDRNRRPAGAALMRVQLRQAAAAGLAPTEAQRLPPQPLFHSQPKQATPLPSPADAPRPEVRQTAGYAVPPTAAMTTNAPPPPARPYPGFNVLEEKPKRGMRLPLIIGAVALAAILGLSLFSSLFSRKERGADSSATASAPVNAPALTSRELILGGGPETRFYAFTAGPGELKLTLNVIGKGSTVTIEVLDRQKKAMPFAGNRSDLSAGSTGSNEEAQARLVVDREKPLLLAVKTTYPDSLQAIRLRIEGPAKLNDAPPSSPLNALFADRDHPKPLTQATVFGGQGAAADSYYAFTAGPGEIKFALDVIGGGSGAEVEVFNEQSRQLRFAGDRNFSVSSTGQHEQGLSKLTLASREKLLMRVRTTYPDSLQAYRLRLDGPIESVAPGSGDSALNTVFARRDNALQLNSKELSSNGLDSDYYYLLRAGPGTVKFELEVAAEGSTFTVELFNADAKPFNFDNGTNKLSVASTGEKARGKAEITLGSEEKLLMRLSNTYPNSMKNYRLKLDGAVKKAFGE
ncbi:MAG: serine/threonine protein kinase [Blastocatellia bacterium]